jgi:hypothetical protein
MIQMSEVMKHQGDLVKAGESIEQTLYILERSFNSLLNFHSGKCRLPYAEYENRYHHLGLTQRAFYIALFKHIDYVGRKGCWRTSFELCKLALSLSPEEDPLAILLLIDYYALKSTDGIKWLLESWEEWKHEKKLGLLPNWIYSIALAQWLHEKDISEQVLHSNLTIGPLQEQWYDECSHRLLPICLDQITE